MGDPYELLGVRRGAEPEVVDAAYRALMKKHHPDRRGVSADPELAQQINAAYTAIKACRTYKPDQQNEPRVWEQPVIEPAPPLQPGRNLAWALMASFVILAVMALVATS